MSIKSRHTLFYAIVVLSVIVTIQSYFMYHMYQTINDNRTSASVATQASTQPEHKETSGKHEVAKSKSGNDNPLSRFDRVFKFDPFQEFQHMQEHMDQLFNAPFNDFPSHSFFSDVFGNASFSQDMNVVDKTDHYEISLEVDDLDKTRLNIDLKNRQLTVTGTMDAENSEDNHSISRHEKSYSRFSRSLTLPGPVKEHGLQSSYHQGILTITVPKA